jgi:tRNA-splicing ligase RtcB
LSRTDARRRFSATEVRRQLEKVRFDDRALEGLRDEAPAAYRDIHKVLRAQRDLVRQERRLTPLLSFKYRDLRR